MAPTRIRRWPRRLLLLLTAAGALLCSAGGKVPAAAVAQAQAQAQAPDASTLLHCGEAGNSAGEIALPVNRTYHLVAEAKSGTTWFQQMAFELLAETCTLYDRSVPGITCRAVCEADRKGICPNDRAQCPLTATTYCRTLRTTYKDTRVEGAPPVVRHVRVETGGKHAIPFLSVGDHPNKTPVLRGVPKWLEKCVLAGTFECRPPATHLTSSLGFHASQVEAMLAPLYPDEAPLRLRHITRSAMPTLEEPQAVLTIIRDPRSVVVSAAHYSPGVNLFGHDGFEQPGTVDTFARATVNMTTAWTQFRRYWLDTLDQAGILPMFKTYYEELVVDPESEVRRLAGFLGLCYADGVVANVTHRNSQQYYEEKGLDEIQHVIMVRPASRPKDVQTGFLKELSAETLAVVNNTMLMTLEPALLERWMGSDYVAGAERQWDAERNVVPSIIQRLRECCGDGTAATETGNRWLGGHCHFGAGGADDAIDPRGTQRAKRATRQHANSDVDSGGGGAGGRPAGGFRGPDGAVNESRLQQWLLNGLNFLSGSMHARLFGPPAAAARKTPAELAAANAAVHAAEQDEEDVLRGRRRRLGGGGGDGGNGSDGGNGGEPRGLAAAKPDPAHLPKSGVPKKAVGRKKERAPPCTPLRHLL